MERLVTFRVFIGVAAENGLYCVVRKGISVVRGVSNNGTVSRMLGPQPGTDVLWPELSGRNTERCCRIQEGMT
jgi:hypothetical protein